MSFVIVFFCIVGALLGVFVVRAARARNAAPLKDAARGLAAGVAAGALWGVDARVVMRIVALVDGREPDFSAEGTLLIVITGAFFGTPLGLAFALVRPRLPRAPGAAGLTFGGAVAALFVVPFALLGAADLEGGLLSPAVVAGTLLFAGSFIGYGLIATLLFARLARERAPQPAERMRLNAV